MKAQLEQYSFPVLCIVALLVLMFSGCAPTGPVHVGDRIKVNRPWHLNGQLRSDYKYSHATSVDGTWATLGNGMRVSVDDVNVSIIGCSH